MSNNQIKTDYNEEVFFINGYYVLKFRETDVYKNFIKVCTDLFNSNEVKDWKDSYKNTKDFVYRPDLFNDIFLNFLQDQDIVKKINHLTKQDLFLEDLYIRKVFPSKNSYTGLFHHRDTHFYNSKIRTGRFPPIYKLIFYFQNTVNNVPQLAIVPGSQLNFRKNLLLDKIFGYFSKDFVISSNNKQCIFFNTMMQHNVIPNKDILNGPQMRIFYNFCSRAQLNNLPNNSSLHDKFRSKFY